MGLKEQSRLDGTSEDQPSRKNGRNESFTTRLWVFESTSYLILPFSAVNKLNMFLKNHPIKVDIFFSTRLYIVHISSLFFQVE